MADLLDGIGLYLQERQLATYDPDGAAGDLFIESMPSSPDRCIVLTIYESGSEPDSLLPYDEPRMQVRVRGGPDPRVSRRLCRRIRSELHGLGPVTLPDGTELILSIALQADAAAIGVDQNGRHEHVCNFRMEIVSRTAHRA